MSEEKRMIDIYEVTNSVWFGGKEYILAEDTSGKNDMPYMTCVARRDNPFGIEEYENAVVSDDYMEMFNTFTERLTDRSKELSAERSENGISNKPLTTADCVKGSLDNSIEGKIVIIKPSCLSPEYRVANHQIKLATGGFGCSPNSRGSAVFCTDIYSGRETRFEKQDIAGVAEISRLPEWARQKIAEIEKPKEKPSMLKTLEETKKVIAEQSAANKDKEKKKNSPEL